MQVHSILIADDVIDSSTVKETLRITKSEAERKQPPTQAEYKELKRLLKDFKIHTAIPEFNTRAEMDMWRKKILTT